MKRLMSVVLGMLLVSSAVLAQQAANATTDEKYHARYTTAGYLQRAGAVCPDDSKRTMAAASTLISGDETKAYARSFPRKVKAWITEGKAVFDVDVRQGGIKPACEAAMRERRKVEDTGKPSSEQ